MVSWVIQFIAAVLAFVLLDFVWLGFVVKNFTLRQLAELGRIADGKFQVLYAPAFVTYFLMALAVVVYVVPQVRESSLINAYLFGALLGLIVFGVYEMTNMAVLKNYPLPFALVDMVWGTFAFGSVTLIVKWTAERIS